MKLLIKSEGKKFTLHFPLSALKWKITEKLINEKTGNVKMVERLKEQGLTVSDGSLVLNKSGGESRTLFTHEDMKALYKELKKWKGLKVVDIESADGDIVLIQI